MGEAGYVEAFGVFDAGFSNLPDTLFPDDTEFAFKGEAIRRFVNLALLDEHLAHERFSREGCWSNHGVIRWDVAPAEDFLSLFANHFFKNAFAAFSGSFIFRQEDISDAISSGKWQVDAAFEAFTGEKIVRRLNQDTGAIAGVLFAAACSTVFKVFKNLKCLFDDVVGFTVLEVHNKAHPAGIVLVSRIVQSLFLWKTLICHSLLLGAEK